MPSDTQARIEKLAEQAVGVLAPSMKGKSIKAREIYRAETLAPLVRVVEAASEAEEALLTIGCDCALETGFEDAHTGTCVLGKLQHALRAFEEATK